jgi:hypothetical protein
MLLACAASARRGTIPYPNPINHVIIIDQENRTTDNLFGSNSPGNQYYLRGLVFATSGTAWKLSNGKKPISPCSRRIFRPRTIHRALARISLDRSLLMPPPTSYASG